MNRIQRREFVCGLTAAAAGLLTPAGRALAQVGGGIGGGGNNNGKDKDNERDEQRRATPTVSIPFDFDGDGRIRFNFDLKPTGTGATHLDVALLKWDERTKAFVKAMAIGSFDQSFKQKTAPIRLPKGKYAVQLQGDGFEYAIKVERGSAKAKTDDDDAWSAVAERSGKV